MEVGSDSEFPICCQSCLGPSPYTRMIKANYDEACKICTSPFTVFHRRQGLEARSKKTVICPTCSKLKNVCQVCLKYLGYGVQVQAVQVRDTLLGVNSNNSISKSDANREYFAKSESNYESSYGKAKPNDSTMVKVQRTMPYYKRNQQEVCIFYKRGNCKRGTECRYKHEIPVESEISKQNVNDRYYGVNDTVVLKTEPPPGPHGPMQPPTSRFTFLGPPPPPPPPPQYYQHYPHYHSERS